MIEIKKSEFVATTQLLWEWLKIETFRATVRSYIVNLKPIVLSLWWNLKNLSRGLNPPNPGLNLAPA